VLGCIMENVVKLAATEANKVESIDPFKFSMHFARLADSLDEEVSELKDIYRLISELCRFHFQPTRPYPFEPEIPDDFSEAWLVFIVPTLDVDIDQLIFTIRGEEYWSMWRLD